MIDRLKAWQARRIRWTAKKLQYWERCRALGRRGYIVRYGVLRYGGVMFVGMTAFQYFRGFGLTWSGLDLFALIVIGLFIWPIAGWFYGSTMWDTMEVSYRTYAKGTPPLAHSE